MSTQTPTSPPPTGQTSGISKVVCDLATMLEDRPPGAEHRLIARSPAMRDVLQRAKHYSKSAATVLLTGESGTGKEVIARLIHDMSSRADKPYVRVNCAALSESLVESEMFGHERGAFTGAVESRPGRFEWADGGTLLLDEISEIPVSLQAKLLRVLEEEEYQRVGSNTTHQVDVRIIATSNRCLEKEIGAGRFRADLYYRLNILEIKIPPLRRRREDIFDLVAYFLDRFKQESPTRTTGVTPEAIELLKAYDWPGNVRQLRNAIHRACLVNATGTIQPHDLPNLEPANVAIPEEFIDMSLEDVERYVIVSNLQKYNGNKTEAAKHLGVTSRTLLNKMKRYRELGFVTSE